MDSQKISTGSSAAASSSFGSQCPTTVADHTKTPWRAGHFSSVVGLPIMAQPDPTQNSMIVATCRGADAEANAAHIVQCVNEMDGLDPRYARWAAEHHETVLQTAERQAEEIDALQAQNGSLTLSLESAQMIVAEVRARNTDMLAALRRAALALAFAAESSPAMEDDYNAVSEAIAKATGAQQP